MGLPDNTYDVILIHFVLHDINPERRIVVLNALARTLRPEGSLLIREPAKPGHGISLSDIRKFMQDCGLREKKTGCTKSLWWNWICDGIFIKSW
jgi:ubiquinone/menaquinone biosynthesis C-methylase UbiE